MLTGDICGSFILAQVSAGFIAVRREGVGLYIIEKKEGGHNRQFTSSESLHEAIQPDTTQRMN